MNSRKKNVARNAIVIIICQFMNTFLGIYNRKVFLSFLGSELLGVNSLFSDVLMLFSFADMGIGTAITFTLYKPIAEQDTAKICSLLGFLQKIYRYVIGLLIVVSIAFLPFLGSLKTTTPLHELTIYYLIFQLDNILSYICAYRETYLIACQRERDLTLIIAIINILRTTAQVVSVKWFANFYIYLFWRLFFSILNKVFSNIYIAVKYPETKLKAVQPLPREEEKLIFRKAKAMLFHRIGNLAINQTDSLIVSYMINVVQWGLVSNYLLLKNTVAAITDRLYSAILPSVGNLIATENKEKQLEILYMYDFLNTWMYSFCFIALTALATPFIELYFGAEMVVEFGTIFMLFFSFFMDGIRAPITTFREAGGAFEKDRWYSILAAIVNLITSVAFVSLVGLPGIYMGTIFAMLVLIISNTVIFFRDQYNTTGLSYLYSLFLKMLAAITACLGTHHICELIRGWMGLSVLSFIIMIAGVIVAPNAFFVLVFGRNQYFKMALSLILKKGR